MTDASATTRRRHVDGRRPVPRRLADRRPQGVRRPRPFGAVRDPRSSSCRCAGLAAVHSASGPIRDAADSATQTPSIFLYLFTLSPERVPGVPRVPRHPRARCSASPSGSTRSTASAPRARCRGSSPSRSTATRSSTASSSPASAPSPSPSAASSPSSAAYGALRLGVGPTGGDLVRIIAFYVVAVVYIALWLALALLLSVVCRRAATAALAAIAIWLVLTLFAGLIAGIVADSAHERARRRDDRGGARQRPPRAARAAAVAGPALQGGDRRAAQPVPPDRPGSSCVDAGRPRPADHVCRSTRACCSPGGSWSASSPARSCCSPARTSTFMRQEVRA